MSRYLGQASRAAGQAEPADMVAWAERESQLVAQGGQPIGHCVESRRRSPFGHEEDMATVDFGKCQQVIFNLAQVGWGRHDELDLIGMLGNQLANHLWRMSRPLMPFMPLGMFPDVGCRIAGLGADRQQIAFERQIECSGGFDGDVPPGFPQLLAEGNEFGKQHWLSAGEDNVSNVEGEHLLQDVVDRQIESLGIPRGKWCIAVVTSKVAAAGSHEHAFRSRQTAFALNRSVDFSDFHGWPHRGSWGKMSIRPLEGPCHHARMGSLQIGAPALTDNFRKTLDTFENQFPQRDYIIETTCPEFTSVCPKTGQPDFGTLTLSYVPDERCVELKSLKMYLQRFRNEGIFYEHVTNRILDDLVAVTQPRSMKLVAAFTPRGGLRSTITVEYCK